MKLEVKTFQQLLNQNEISLDVQGCLNKKWVSVEVLREFIVSDQRNKFREAILNDYGQVKSTTEKLLWELKK